MPKVLLITYFFPPLGSVQVLRAVKFTKYLPRFNWTPVVLAVKDIWHYYQDETLMEELPASLVIYRTHSLDPFRLLAKFKPSHPDPSNINPHSEHNPERKSFQNFRVVLNEFNRWFSLPDSRFGWYPFAVKEGLEIIKNENISLIYSCSPPNICHLVARKIHQETGISWVADFKDMWFDYPHQLPTPLHRKIMLHWEKQILSQCNQAITVNPAITADFQKRYPLYSHKIKTIVHGYDPEEYTGITPKPSNKFKLVYTGSFFEPRQIPDYFFKALAAWIKENPEVKTEVSVQLVGTLAPRHQKLITELNLNDIIQVIPPVSRKEAIQYQVDATVLMLLVGEGKRSELVMPAKTWEYLATGNPILCLAPQGVTASLIQETESGVVVPPEDIEQIKSAIKEYYDQWKEGKLHRFKCCRFPQYERGQLTGELAELFNSCLK